MTQLWFLSCMNIRDTFECDVSLLKIAVTSQASANIRRCGRYCLIRSFHVDRSPRKAKLLPWKQRSEPVPAPCPAGPGGTLNCERQVSDTTLLLGIQRPVACLNLYWETSTCPQSQKRVKPTRKQHNFFIPSSQVINLASLARCRAIL